MNNTSRSARSRNRQILRALLVALAVLWGAAPLGLLGMGLPSAYAAADLTVKVYNDSGRDGVDTGGAEPGVAGAQVAIYNIDGNTAGLVNSNPSGLASFPSLPPGSYMIEISNINASGTHVVSIAGASDTNPGLVSRVTVGATPQMVAVGLRPLSGGADLAAPAGTRSITSRIWDDRNANGRQDAGEPGVAGLTVQLLNSSNTLIATAVSGVDGRYKFDLAPAGAGYKLRVVGLPSGYAVTRAAAPSTNAGNDSNGALVGPNVEVTIPSGGTGQNDDSLDVGFTKGYVSGFIWRDVNADGFYDSETEAKTNGVQVQLVDAGNTVVMTTTTRALLAASGPSPRPEDAGFFEFNDVSLSAGPYRVRVPNPEFLPGKPLHGAANSPTTGLTNDQATPDGLPGLADVQIGPFTLDGSSVAGGSNRMTNAYFGFYKGSVGDFVWQDVDRDGLQTGEESLGIDGVLLFVDDGRGGGTPGDGIRNGGEITTTTRVDPNTNKPGYYLFSDLPLGPTYRVVLDGSNFAAGGLLEGLGNSTGLAGTAGGNRIVSRMSANLTDDEPTDFNVDFGITDSDLGNVVWEDLNGDGVKGIGEPAIVNATVRLLNAADQVVYTTLTDPNGLYRIPGRPAGQYYMTFDLATVAPALPANYVASVQPAGWPGVNPNEKSPVDNGDYNDVTAPVGGRSWRTPLFTIDPGTPGNPSVNNGVDAGFFGLTSLSGRAFFDADADNQDEPPPAEPGMPQIAVELLKGPTVVLTTTTNATGVYTFTGVLPGTYVVRFNNPDPGNFAYVAPNMPAPGHPLASDVDPMGRTLPLNLVSNSPQAEIDAGMNGRSSVSGRVFLDNDASDTQNGPDADLVGATAQISVTTSLPNLSATYTRSATNPNYTFAGLPGGNGVSYQLVFSPPPAAPAYQSSTRDRGGNDAVDSDGPAIVVNNPGTNTPFDYDQGYFQPVTISARAFEENSGAAIDNQFNPADASLQGVQIVLKTLAGTPVLTQTTDANGLVSFTTRPGSYQLDIDQNAAALNGLNRSPGHLDPLIVAPTPLLSNGSSLTDNAGKNSFGYYRAATVTGRVFFDGASAVPDNLKAGEPGLQGVTVGLSGAAAMATTTDASGVYTFTGLFAGNYTVTITNPDTSNFAFISGGDSSVMTAGPVATSSTSSFVLPYGGSVAKDAGVVGQSSVNGRVVTDANADGDLTPDTAVGLPDVTVKLTMTVTLPNLSTTVARTTTTSAGNYSFGTLPAGNFDLGFVSPSGYLVTTADAVASNDSDGYGSAADQLLQQGLAAASTQTRDQGYFQNVTISARVFEDTVAINNQFDAGESGLAGVGVSLDSVPPQTATTDANGLVTFSVRPGSYTLTVTPPAGFNASPGNSGSIGPITLSSGGSSLTELSPPGTTNVFGYYRESTITGRVFFDRNGDSLKAGEPGLQGVTVGLSGAAAMATTTDASGVYTFTGVLPGNYTLTITNPDPSNFAFISGGDSSVTTAGPVATTSTGSFAATGGSVTKDAGMVGQSSVNGRVATDANADGDLSGDLASSLPNITVNLTMTVNLPGRLNTTINRMTTTSAGTYSFGGLPGGATLLDAQFSLGFVSPSGYLVTTADAVASNDSDGYGSAADQLLQQGLAAASTQTRDQGYFQNVTISARVFEDTVAINNSHDGGEPGISSVVVSLNSVPPQTATTDANGLVTFSVRPGSYTISVPTPAGYTASPPNSGQATIGPLTSGQAAAEQQFGYYRPATISGDAWFDANGNGLKGGDEPGMQDITVTLIRDPNGTAGDGDDVVVGTPQLTNAGGAYSFAGVAPTNVPGTPGSYRIRFSLPASFAFTALGAPITTDHNNDADSGGYSGLFTVASNGTVTYVDAGYLGTLSIGDLVWEDLNGNGLQDAGEPGLAGVVVSVQLDTVGINNTNPQITVSATSTGSTNLGGNYLLDKLPPASAYRIVGITAPFGYKPTLANVGSNPAIDSNGLVGVNGTLPPSDPDLDFGFYQTATVGDRVWLDINNNGTYEQGVDIGYPGVTVQLLDSATSAIISTTTTLAGGNQGFYQFQGMDPGSYAIQFNAPAGLQFVNNGAGQIATDNDNDAATNGRTAVFGVPSKTILATIDAGLVGQGGISGIGWEDGNKNDIRDSNEAKRVPGVQVTLTITPTGMIAPIVLTQTTDPNGNYSYTNLPPGNFTLAFRPPAGFYPVRSNIGDAGGTDSPNDSDAPLVRGALSPAGSITGLDAGYRTSVHVYLPLVYQPDYPELVGSFRLSTGTIQPWELTVITVTITNTVDAPASQFWVDFYINPIVPPAGANQPWNKSCGTNDCPYGIAWYVSDPIAPGQSITLTSTSNSYVSKNTRWPGFFPVGVANLYLYVDSWNPGLSWGAVFEKNEANNRAEYHQPAASGADVLWAAVWPSADMPPRPVRPESTP